MAKRNLYNLKLVQFLAVLSMQAHFGRNNGVTYGFNTNEYQGEKKKHRYEKK